MTLACVVLLAVAQSAGSTSLPQPPPATPPAAPAATDVDPARLVFPADAAGLVLVAVKPDRTADYEAMIHALHAALGDADTEARRIGEGWRVYKAADTDAKGNALYVHLIATPLADADYRPSVVVGRLLRELPAELLVKYRDAFAGATTRLSLSLLADLALTPVAPGPRR
ncbi:MAG: hypothetical protein AB7U83_18935 [Vicinamibacterales bacterium]